MPENVVEHWQLQRGLRAEYSHSEIRNRLADEAVLDLKKYGVERRGRIFAAALPRQNAAKIHMRNRYRKRRSFFIIRQLFKGFLEVRWWQVKIAENANRLLLYGKKEQGGGFGDMAEVTDTLSF